MKRFFVLILTAIMVVSCGTARMAQGVPVEDPNEVSYILSNYYPHLYNYYLEGVLIVKSMNEITLADGSKDYKVKYKLVRYYYDNFDEALEVVRKHFPELYRMCAIGATDIREVYKYVDRRSGKVRYHVSYYQVYELYYYHYPVPYVGPRYHRPIHMGINHPKPHPQTPPANTPRPTRPSNHRR